VLTLPARARAAAPRVGVLTDHPTAVSVLGQGLRDAGWDIETGLRLVRRTGTPGADRWRAAARELAALPADVLVAGEHAAVRACLEATATTPIVALDFERDPVASGFVKSLARPGGNVTGMTLVATEQSTKRLELIKQISPGLSRIAALWNADASGHQLQLKELERVAPVFQITLQSLPIRNGDELDAALRAALQANAQAIVTMDDPLIQSNRARIIEFALQHRLFVMGEFRVMAVAGGLMSYGPSLSDMWRHAATFVDKILKGAKPADLPVEQPTKFELIINLKTARALGLDIPPALLARADEVIE